MTFLVLLRALEPDTVFVLSAPSGEFLSAPQSLAVIAQGVGVVAAIAAAIYAKGAYEATRSQASALLDERVEKTRADRQALLHATVWWLSRESTDSVFDSTWRDWIQTKMNAKERVDRIRLTLPNRVFSDTPDDAALIAARLGGVSRRLFDDVVAALWTLQGSCAKWESAAMGGAGYLAYKEEHEALSETAEVQASLNRLLAAVDALNAHARADVSRMTLR